MNTDKFLGVAIRLEEYQIPLLIDVLRQCMQKCKIQETILISPRNILSLNDVESSTNLTQDSRMTKQMIDMSYIIILKYIFNERTLTPELFNQTQCFYESLYELILKDQRDFFLEHAAILMYDVDKTKTSRKFIEIITENIVQKEIQIQYECPQKEKQNIQKLNEQIMQLASTNETLAARIIQCQQAAQQAKTWWRAQLKREQQYRKQQSNQSEDEREQEQQRQRENEQEQQRKRENEQEQQRQRENEQEQQRQREREQERQRQREREEEQQRKREREEEQQRQRERQSEQTKPQRDDDTCPCRNVDPRKCETKKDYFKQSRIFHPDKNPGCKELAAEKMQLLNNLCEEARSRFGKQKKKYMSFREFQHRYKSVKNASPIKIKMKYLKYLKLAQKIF